MEVTKSELAKQMLSDPVACRLIQEGRGKPKDTQVVINGVTYIIKTDHDCQIHGNSRAKQENSGSHK